MHKFKEGQNVFINDSFNHEEPCTIVKCVENESSTGQNVYIVKSVNGFTFATEEECIYETIEDAHVAWFDSFIALIDKYKAEIKDVVDLVAFPLKHCICGDNCEYEAKRAYQARCLELIKVDVYDSEVRR